MLAPGRRCLLSTVVVRIALTGGSPATAQTKGETEGMAGGVSLSSKKCMLNGELLSFEVR